MDINSQVCAYK